GDAAGGHDPQLQGVVRRQVGPPAGGCLPLRRRHRGGGGAGQEDGGRPVSTADAMSSRRGRTLQCVVVTPERAVLDAAVGLGALPMYDGELGVAPGRAPLIGRLGYGELRVRQGPRVSRYYVDGGFVQVRADVVSVLTPRGVEADKIDVAAATHA